mmetsp:Transcript_52534/g.145318  ORF Transcript_52534/g.145318 Transcript_52534/m.145318 type:complete len:203 (+) Transcript_52534:127-735(+)
MRRCRRPTALARRRRRRAVRRHPLCAAYEQIQFTPGNASERTGCCIWLENESIKAKATVAHIICKTFGEFSFYNLRAMKGSGQSPSTNHIVACDKCPIKQYFWSYNMAVHMAAAHLNVPLSAELTAEITMRDKERADLVKLKVAKLSKRKRKEREEKEQEQDTAAKAARLQEEMARAPLGRGHRAAAATAATATAAPTSPAD